MRQYTDSADAIKAYAEEVNFDFTNVKVEELTEGEDNERGGLKLAFQNYTGDDMEVTVIHTWFDTFSVTFWTEEKGNETIDDIYFPELLDLFKGLKVALTGVSQDEWNRILNHQSQYDIDTAIDEDYMNTREQVSIVDGELEILEEE